jgi:hypothetical protein
MSTLNPDTQNAITEESRSLGHLDWFEVQEVRGFDKLNSPAANLRKGLADVSHDEG